MEKEALNYCGGGIENAGLLRKSLCQLQNCWGVCSSHIHCVCVSLLEGVSHLEIQMSQNYLTFHAWFIILVIF